MVIYCPYSAPGADCVDGALYTNLDKVPALKNLEPIWNNCNTNNLRIRHRNRCKETEKVKKVT